MRYITYFFIGFFLSCSNPQSSLQFRKNFTSEEKNILTTARSVISESYYGTLITIDNTGQARARVMEPFSPEKDFCVWMATNPNSRKVKQIRNNPKATLHYFDKKGMGYVSLMGKAYIVNDQHTKNKIWKKGWEKFYKNRQDAYLLIRFVPQKLELISIPNDYTGDPDTWQPHSVLLRK